MAANDLDRGDDVAGGIAAVRDAFVASGHGKLTCIDARMKYDHAVPNSQVVSFVGHDSDGREFSVESKSLAPGSSLMGAAKILAMKLLRERGYA